ncbi:MAG TPA: aminotransferase class III-fold pyridoxal phosphate-dependent enzyme [Solirubrobacteraceae bacterium]|jgi:4-aminobutyrate aminotransferase-like enzyme|nr:aminotransferase class III-fold pyridoxal phosphate-dependent enzyme [Solirubrobacteraceae bacterium]
MSRVLSTSLTAGRTAVPAVVGAAGIHLRLADGRDVIDASNTAAPLGHAHPEVIEALRAEIDSPALNEGWGWGRRDAAAEELLTTAFAGEESWVGAVRFFLSGSEANDAMLSLAQALTGRSALATRERAYHGGSGLAREMTVQPHWHGGLTFAAGGTREVPRSTVAHQLPMPVRARIRGERLPLPERGELAGTLSESAAVLPDYSQGGVYHVPAYQDLVARAAREHGALLIADEVVTGMGRTGGWFAFQQGTSRPDAVTLGKPLAAGAMPAAAVVLSSDLVDRLEGGSWQSYSTFRSHPLMMPAIRAHLRVSARDGLPERARALDGFLAARLAQLADAHPSVSRIDGVACTGRSSSTVPTGAIGEEAEPLASRVAARSLEAGALIATSGEQTPLFIAPPLISDEEDLTRIVAALDHGLGLADAEYEVETARSGSRGS